MSKTPATASSEVRHRIRETTLPDAAKTPYIPSPLDFARRSEKPKEFIVPSFLCGVKVALFLGAGASVFASQPTTAELLKRVQDRIRSRKDEPRRNSTLQAYITQVVESDTYDDVEDLYDGIDSTIATNRNPNCKPIIGEAAIRGVPYGEIIDELNSLKGTIREVLLNSFDIREDKVGLIKHMYDTIWSIMESYGTNEFHVFTTNYDLVIEEYCNESNLDIINGFRPYRYQKLVWDDVWNHDGEKPSLYLTKLHGSISWRRDADGEIVEVGGTAPENADDDIMIAPTSGAKDYGREPFPALMGRFKEVMSGVDMLLVIGFSYRDDEIVDIINDNVERGMELVSISPNTVKDVLRAFDIDIKAEELDDGEIQSIGPTITTYKQKFGPDTVIAMSNMLAVICEQIQQTTNGGDGVETKKDAP